jgi:hypothetical protein
MESRPTLRDSPQSERYTAAREAAGVSRQTGRGVGLLASVAAARCYDRQPEQQPE